ncbi:MAG: hypothetical protein CME71_06020 [Halobacteriovorax sp.]|nr:hypothetical protein [Halobacteriovorax sp.]
MLLSIFRLLAPITILLLSSPLEAQNRNPNHRLLIAKENAVKQTSIGMDAAESYEARTNNAALLYGSDKKVFESVKVNRQLRLQFNIQLNSASFEYLSWIVMAGLVDFSVESLVVDGFKTDLPHFIERDFFVYAAAMEYYEETGFSAAGDIDYANHPQFSFARDQMLPLAKMLNLWRTNRPAFFEHLVLRRKKLDGGVLSIEAYLQRTDLSRKQREAALMLEQMFNQTY